MGILAIQAAIRPNAAAIGVWTCTISACSCRISRYSRKIVRRLDLGLRQRTISIGWMEYPRSSSSEAYVPGQQALVTWYPSSINRSIRGSRSLLTVTLVVVTWRTRTILQLIRLMVNALSASQYSYVGVSFPEAACRISSVKYQVTVLDYGLVIQTGMVSDDEHAVLLL